MKRNQENHCDHSVFISINNHLDTSIPNALCSYKEHSLGQRFPNCSPRTPGGTWGSDRGSAGKWENCCFLVEFREKECVNFCIQSLLKISS